MDEKTQATKRLEFLQREYWRLRNGKQRFMRCPYCTEKATKRNFPHMPRLCCPMFAKAFKAILDRQEKVNEGMQLAAQAKMDEAPLVKGYVN
jgi:hypothetical protein